MKFLRFMLEIILGIMFFPLIVVILIFWLFYCMRAAKILNRPIKDGVKAWFKYIKVGLEMNKDFIINGL